MSGCTPAIYQQALDTTFGAADSRRSFGTPRRKLRTTNPKERGDRQPSPTRSPQTPAHTPHRQDKRHILCISRSETLRGADKLPSPSRPPHNRSLHFSTTHDRYMPPRYLLTSPTRSSGNGRPVPGSTTSRSSPFTRAGYPQPTSLHHAGAVVVVGDDDDGDGSVSGVAGASLTCVACVYIGEGARERRHETGGETGEKRTGGYVM